MAEQLTHWKKMYNPDYLGAYSLDNPTMVVTIKAIEKKEVVSDGGKKKMCVVAQLVDQKQMILNATNLKILDRMYGHFIEKWIGKKITLYIANVKFGSEYVEALRIQEAIPKEGLPELTPSHEKWNDAVKGMSNGVTIAQIKTKYTLSAANEAALKKLIPKDDVQNPV